MAKILRAQHETVSLHRFYLSSLFQVATESSGDNEETIRRAYQDAKTVLLSEEPNAVACLQRVLTMEDNKSSKTVWGFKAVKHLVVANIQAVSFVVSTAAKDCREVETFNEATHCAA